MWIFVFNWECRKWYFKKVTSASARFTFCKGPGPGWNSGLHYDNQSMPTSWRGVEGPAGSRGKSPGGSPGAKTPEVVRFMTTWLQNHYLNILKRSVSIFKFIFLCSFLSLLISCPLILDHGAGSNWPCSKSGTAYAGKPRVTSARKAGTCTGF